MLVLGSEMHSCDLEGNGKLKLCMINIHCSQRDFIYYYVIQDIIYYKYVYNKQCEWMKIDKILLVIFLKGKTASLMVYFSFICWDHVVFSALLTAYLPSSSFPSCHMTLVNLSYPKGDSHFMPPYNTWIY